MIKTHVDPETYRRLSRLRRDEGLPSISALFLKKCELLTDSSEADEIVRGALKRVKERKEIGEEFCLRDLFTQWEDYSKGARLRAGKLFFQRVQAARDGIHPCGKNRSGQQLYRKTSDLNE